MIDDLIRLSVNAKLSELASVPTGAASGRRLTGDDLQQQGIALTPEQLHAGIAKTFCDVAERLGIQFFQSLPAAVLEQFVLMSILRNEDCAGLLKSLINSFMISYITQETSGEAFDHLLGLEGLRARVAKSRNVIQRPMTPHAGPTSH